MARFLFLSLLAVEFLTFILVIDRSQPLVAISARCFVGLWLLASAGMLLLKPRDWEMLTMRTKLVRLGWSLGFIVQLIHVVIAFGLIHSWSHEAAMKHVEKVGGFGEGIFVNYLFSMIWLMDVIWWWASPTGYPQRPRWIGCCVHGFMAFITFNATVVFGPHDAKISDLLAFGIIALLWWRKGKLGEEGRLSE
jgi:hypothetical protein